MTLPPTLSSPADFIKSNFEMFWGVNTQSFAVIALILFMMFVYCIYSWVSMTVIWVTCPFRWCCWLTGKCFGLFYSVVTGGDEEQGVALITPET